jgi:hypothetical protein
VAKYCVHGLGERRHAEIRQAIAAVRPIDQNGVAAGDVAGTDVAPAVAHHVRRCKVDVPARHGLFDHAGLRLVARTAVISAVRTEVDVVQGDRGAHLAVHLFEVSGIELAVRELRLVREDDADEAGIPQALHLRAGLRHEHEVLNAGRGVRGAVPHDLAG